MEIKKSRIFDNYIYATAKSWVFGLDDEKQRQFGILFEIINMDEATGEKEFKDYPFLVSASIVADKCHRSFNEMDESCKPTKASLLYDAVSYMGGVPVDHILVDAVKSGSEPKDLSAFDSIANQFTSRQAIVKGQTADFGTVAAQRGRGVKHQYLQFKTESDAERFVDILLGRAGAIGMMIGFILDRPINMIGETGWSVIRKHVYGKGA